MAQNLQQQAAGYASAAVPTLGSINKQYGQSIGDAQNFAEALVRLLQQGAGADPYSGAVASQTAANQAAVQRLQALGGPYGAGAAAAVGGAGDSILGALNSRRAAAQTYLKALPGIAAAKGEQSALALRNARGQAITQRNQQYSQAFQQSLQQLRSQQIQQSQFAQNLGLQRSQMAQQASQFASSQAQQWREFTMGLAARSAASSGGTSGSTNAPSGWQAILSGNTSALANASGLTNNEVSGQIKNANGILSPAAQMKSVAVYGTDANGNKIITGYRQVPSGADTRNFFQRGTSFGQALNDLISQGVSAPIAFYAAANLYKQARPAPNGSPARLAYVSFLQWMAHQRLPGYANLLYKYTGGRQKKATTPGGKPLPTR